jgi:rhomboid protease GluP
MAQVPPGAFEGAPISFVLVLANLAVFAGEVIASRSPSSLVVVPPSVYLAFGANYAPLTLALGQYERLVTSCFLHGSLLHVAVNMWSLRQLGPFVERMAGLARFAVLYVVTGIVGSLASVLWGVLSGREAPSVGASGAICGVMGAALVLGVRLEGWRSPIAKQIAFWLVILGVFGATVKGIDNACHLGGVIAGCAVAAVWKRGVRYSTTATALSLAASATVCLASGASLAWREASDPFANLGPNARIHRVQDLLDLKDCPGAEQAFRAAENVNGDAPELKGVRATFDQKCPRLAN